MSNPGPRRASKAPRVGWVRVFGSLFVSLFLHGMIVVPVTLLLVLTAPEASAEPEEQPAGSPEIVGSDEGAEEVVYDAPISVTLAEDLISEGSPLEDAIAATEAGAASKASEKPPAGGRSASANRHERTHEAVEALRAKGGKQPCDREPAIQALGGYTWSVERGFVDFYAKNLKELAKLGRVDVHEDGTGRPDGFAVKLPRCSVLRQGGLRSGDVVHDINGKRVTTIPQAVSAWFALRNTNEIKVSLTREGKPMTLRFRIEE